MDFGFPQLGNQYSGAQMRNFVTRVGNALNAIRGRDPIFYHKNGLAGVVIGTAGVAGTDATGAYTFFIDPATGAASFAGTVTASAGAIGGFNIGTDYIRDAANSFGLASTVTGGDDVRFWAGDTFANRATAPARIYESGAVYFSSGTFAGNVNTTGYVKATGGVAGAFSTAAIVGDPAAANVGGGQFTATGSGVAVTGYIGLAGGTNSAGVFNAVNSNNFAVQIVGNTSAAALAISAGAGQPSISTAGTITSGQITANLTGNVTGNASGSAATVTGAAQSAITSVGTLSSLTTSGQITSTLANGTKPLAVTSSTMCDNLNAHFLGGYLSSDLLRKDGATQYNLHIVSGGPTDYVVTFT